MEGGEEKEKEVSGKRKKNKMGARNLRRDRNMSEDWVRESPQEIVFEGLT